MTKNDIPKSFYDCEKLFPPNVGIRNIKNLPVESKRWLALSSVTVGAVGLASKFWLQGCNSVIVYNYEALLNALDRRPSGTPLITVANHHSCMDDPLLWGILNVRHLLNQTLMRWSLTAHDICFTKSYHSKFFSYGKSVPIVRGDGVYQQGMNFALERLNEGNWLHIYPEGKVNESKSEMRLKWGVGRLVADAAVTPVVLPFYHQGMDSVLPTKSPYIPRILKKVTVLIGNPIELAPLLQELRQKGASDEEKRKAITDVIQTQMYKLRVLSEVLHARHLSGGLFNRKIPFKFPSES